MFFFCVVSRPMLRRTVPTATVHFDKTKKCNWSFPVRSKYGSNLAFHLVLSPYLSLSLPSYFLQVQEIAFLISVNDILHKLPNNKNHNIQVKFTKTRGSRSQVGWNFVTFLPHPSFFAFKAIRNKQPSGTMAKRTTARFQFVFNIFCRWFPIRKSCLFHS